MPSESAPSRDADRWVGDRDDLALFAIVLAVASLAVSPAFDYLLVGPGAQRGADGPLAALALFVALAVGAALIVSNAGDRLETLLDPPADGETAWHEVRRFGFAFWGAALVLGLLLSVLLKWRAIPNAVAVVVVQTLLVGLPAGALALRRRGWLLDAVWKRVHAVEVKVVSPSEAGESPTDDETSDVDDWDRWDDVALFAALFFVGWFGVSSQYAILIGVGEGLGVVLGTAAVALRRAGALVPDDGDSAAPPRTAESTDGGDGATAGTD